MFGGSIPACVGWSLVCVYRGFPAVVVCVTPVGGCPGWSSIERTYVRMENDAIARAQHQLVVWLSVDRLTDLDVEPRS
jgi:hypothetical protein